MVSIRRAASRFRLAFAIVAIALALGGCATRGGAGDGGAGSAGARVFAHELTDLAAYPHYVAVEMSPPWAQEGRWLLRAPETIGSDRGLLFIDHPHPEMFTVTDPIGPIRWIPDAGSGWQYTALLDLGLELRTRAIPEGDSVRIESTLTNHGVGDFDNLGTQYCLVQTGVKGFGDPEGVRTFIPVNGEFISLRNTHPPYAGTEPPMFIVTNTRDQEPWAPFEPGNSWAAEEQADVPLIATVSEDGQRLIAIAFDNAYKIMSNCRIPCIHADPVFPRCPLGGTVKVEGRVYFMEADFGRLLERFYADFPAWRSKAPAEQ